LREHDQQFFDNFMLVVGILIGVTVGLFILARLISVETQEEYVRQDPEVQAAIEDRIRPVGRVVLRGQEETPAAAEAVAAPAPVETTLSGPQVYNAACYVCHAPPGIGGAPPLGDAASWAPRVAQGMEVLRDHAINGYQGQTGYMPPKGGRMDLSDEEVLAGLDFMLEQVPPQ
jgi:cytochrome c5